MKVFILVLLLAIPFLSYGQDKTKTDPSLVKGVRFSVELVGSARFKPGDSISVKVRLKNTNKTRVYLFKHLGLGIGGFRISILDANNRTVPRNFIAESFPPTVWTKDDFQSIEPGKSFEEQITIPLESYEIEPGDYSLIVSFLTPVPAASDVPSGLLILTSDDFFGAKPIRFKVWAP
jgi:hypothetical protein